MFHNFRYKKSLKMKMSTSGLPGFAKMHLMMLDKDYYLTVLENKQN